MLAASSAQAAPNKPVSLTLSVGSSPPAGLTSARALPAGITIAGYQLTLTNNTKTQMLGSANVTKPEGFVVDGVSSDHGSAVLNGNVIELRTLEVGPGGSVTVSMTLQAPCTLGSQSAWVVFPKQSNDYNGTGNDLTPVGGDDPRMSLTDPCALRFGAKPADSVKTDFIRSVRFDAGSDPVTVQAVDGRDDTLAQPMPWFDGQAISLARVPAGAVAGNSATTTDGVASFPSLQIGTAGFYKLVASTTAAGFPSDSRNTSPQFYIVDQSTDCAATGCVGQRKNAQFTVDAGAAAKLVLSDAVAPDPSCAPAYTPPRGTTWYDFLLTQERATTVFTTYTKDDLKGWKGGANALQICFAVPDSTLFAGSPFDYNNDNGLKEGSVGLLPDCPLVRLNPCVTGRGPFGNGGAFIEFWVPASLADPRYH
jgi:hypothetical protein